MATSQSLFNEVFVRSNCIGNGITRLRRNPFSMRSLFVHLEREVERLTLVAIPFQ